jgi:CRP-like cAMP-binding protein
VNLWREWARIETVDDQRPYAPPQPKDQFAGIVLSLARQEEPDMSGYTDAEIVARIRKRHHAGLIVASGSEERVRQLLESYVDRFRTDFHASAPPPARAVE